jgi:hypothetical protein
MRFPIMEEHLDVNSYLEYEKLHENCNWSYEELDKFFEAHGLPTTEDIKNQNLRMYIWSSIPVKIYDMNEFKKNKKTK